MNRVRSGASEEIDIANPVATAKQEIPKRCGRDEHPGIQDGAQSALSALAAPRPAHGVHLAVGQFERFIGVQRLAGLASLLVERGGDALCPPASRR